MSKFLSLLSSKSTLPHGGEHSLNVDDCVRDLVFQAGVDFETRPILIFCTCGLPDPKLVSYDLLLSRIIEYFDQFAESDYTVVLFAAGSRYQVPWTWLWKAYRNLGRKFRKNLKRMVVVHSNWFTRMLFSAAGSIISPKFFRKLVYASTLTELAGYVPLNQINIPKVVYEENAKREANIRLPPALTSEVFGRPLEIVMPSEQQLPKVVLDAASYIREAGLETEGIFRRSPSSALLKQVVAMYDRGEEVRLRAYNDPHLAAVLLKKFLRDLPAPMFGPNMYSLIGGCPLPLKGGDPRACKLYIRNQILPSLQPPCKQALLKYVIGLLRDVASKAEHSLMNSYNLAVVISPNLLRGPDPLADVAMCNISPKTSTLAFVVKYSIEMYPDIFE